MALTLPNCWKRESFDAILYKEDENIFWFLRTVCCGLTIKSIKSIKRTRPIQRATRRRKTAKTMTRLPAISRLIRGATHHTRAIWFALLAMHVPALIAVGSSIWRGEDSFSAVSIVGLLLTVAFFVLKCLDVPYLRMRGRGAKIAFLLVCAFVHRGVVSGPVAEQIIDTSPVIAVAGAVAICSSKRVRRRVGDFIRTIQRSLVRANVVVRSILGLVWHIQPRPGIPICRVGTPARGPRKSVV